ncbi:MAG: rplT [Dehalococcoidia bacterium]|nr:rplT [Dehalococcoidia bacterium]
MPRTKHGVPSRARHNKVLHMAKGHRGVRHTLYRRAKESLLHALSYAFRHRRERKGDMRRLWIVRINASARQHGLSYSQLVHGLDLAGVEVDRKILADLAVRDPNAFAQLAATAKESLSRTAATAAPL